MSSPVPSASGKRVRVLHVLEAIFGGTARHLCDLVAVARDVDHIVVVPSERFGRRTDERAVEALRRAGAEVHVIDMRRTPTHPDNLFAFFRLARLIRETRPDVVHGHSSIGGALARAAATTVRGTPTVWTPNGLLNSRPVLAIERILARRTTATVAVSPSEAELMRTTRLDRAGELVVIPNGIDLGHEPEPSHARERLGIPDAAPVVGSISRLAPQKAPLDFIDCCQLIHDIRPETHFILVGDGELQDDVEARLAQWDHRGHFHHIPFLPDAPSILPICDIFVLLSRYEGAPYAPLEAMRAGVPVVLSDVVGNRDAVEDGRSGILVPPGDPAAAAKATVGLIDSPTDRANMAQQAYLRLYRIFDRETMGSELSSLYHRLAGVPRPPAPAGSTDATYVPVLVDAPYPAQSDPSIHSTI